MSNLGLDFGPGPEDGPEGGPEAGRGDLPEESVRPARARGARRAERRGGRLRGCLPLLLVAAVVLGVAWVGGSWVVDRVQEYVGEAPDYPGPGTGSVVVEVRQGDTATMIGRELKAAGVVKSVDAFTDAARADERSSGIQVGFYELKKEMSASAALAVLVDPKNLVQARVTIPEGLRVVDVVARIADQTDFTKKQLNAALKDAEALGLPAYAEGNPEGYLFPATYEVGPKETAAGLLKRMVTRWRQAADEAGLEAAAKRLGYTPHELMTIASLVEAEARREQDRGKVARVIYNRLETEGAPTYGKLEIDATVNYAHGRSLGVAISAEDLEIDSPYNTRKYPGLPPGPIESPGSSAIEAAANPTEGPWFFYVTVDLRTGETKFAESYDEFLGYKAELQEYCESSDAC